MIFRVVPYELVENLFGTWVADNFNKINLVLLIIGFLCWALFGNHSKKTTVTKREPVQKQDEFIYYMDEDGHLVQEKTNKAKVSEIKMEDQPIAENYFGQYDRYSDLTDEEMKLAMQIHVNRTEPTFEEWKAAREKEQGKGGN